MTTLDTQLVALNFGIGKSIRYHAKRRAFFDVLHRGAMAISAIGGSTAFAAIVGELGTNPAGGSGGGTPELAKWSALAVAIAAALEVVLGFSERARRHDALVQRFADMAAEILRAASPTDDQVREWLARRREIEAEEPTGLTALNVRCHNEEAQALGYGPEYQDRVRGWQTVVCHLLTLPPNEFPPLSAAGSATSTEVAPPVSMAPPS